MQPPPSLSKGRSRVGSNAPSHLVRLAEAFFLLGGLHRLVLVERCLDHPVRVADLAEHAGLSQSLVSHHLRQLKDAQLL